MGERHCQPVAEKAPVGQPGQRVVVGLILDLLLDLLPLRHITRHTDDLAKLLRLAEEHGSKVVLVGDPHQLGAVGPGGIFRTLVADHGAHELETVRRFHHAWEAAASLHLREGNPAILDAYDRHGRVTSGSRAEMIDRAFDAWRAALSKGEFLLLMAGDNATATNGRGTSQSGRQHPQPAACDGLATNDRCGA